MTKETKQLIGMFSTFLAVVVSLHLGLSDHYSTVIDGLKIENSALRNTVLNERAVNNYLNNELTYQNDMSKTKAYICGPISKLPNLNKQAFKDAEYDMIRKGHAYADPHFICRNLKRSDYISDKAFWNECMKLCIPEMISCDYVYVLKGWEHSEGAKIEVNLAKQLDIPIIYEL